MSAPEAAACMHNRLHAGNTRLRTLPTITADAPASLAQARHDGCDACTEANATRHPHHLPPARPPTQRGRRAGHPFHHGVDPIGVSGQQLSHRVLGLRRNARGGRAQPNQRSSQHQCLVVGSAHG
eukprot:3306939-Pleurochrysis_carterae.AAC.2